MTEVSFPVVNQPLSEAQWKTIALGIGQGIVDRGGFPYRLTSRSDVNNTVTISVDTKTGRNEAILDGFAHQIDTAKVLSVPAVSTTTTYEIGLVYDPTQHGATGGPVKLSVWTSPADYSGGKNRLVLYTLVRQPSQALTAAALTEFRPRLSPQIIVTNQSHLPNAGTMIVDTVATDRATGTRWRAHSDGAGNMSWVELNSGVAGSPYATGGTAIMRWSSGVGGYVEDPDNAMAVANKRYVDAKAAAAEANAIAADKYSSRYAEGESLIMRWSGGQASVGTPTASEHAATKGYVDGKTWDGSKITSGWLDGYRVRFSNWAYDTAQSGNVYTVSVNSDGRLMRFTSARKFKADEVPLEELVDDPRRLLGITPVTFHRLDPETGQVPEGARREWGVIADDELERVPELVLLEPNPETGILEPEGWDTDGQVAAHQLLLRWLAQRVDALEGTTPQQVTGARVTAERTGPATGARLHRLEAENRELRAQLGRLLDHLGLEEHPTPTDDPEGV